MSALLLKEGVGEAREGVYIFCLPHLLLLFRCSLCMRFFLMCWIMFFLRVCAFGFNFLLVQKKMSSPFVAPHEVVKKISCHSHTQKKDV